MDFYWKKFKCYDDQIDIRGDYNSNSVDHLHLSFARCNPEERGTCKSDEEYNKFVDRLFYIHLHNSVRFTQTGYGEDKLKKESRFVWTSCPDGNKGDEIVYSINNKEVRLQDSRLFSLS